VVGRFTEGRAVPGWLVRRRVHALALIAAVGLGAILLPGRAVAAPTIARYVALGDSYTAGPGIPSQVTWPAGCRRSDHDYPALVNATLRAATFRDMSCSGATTASMIGAQPTMTGGSNPAQLSALTPHTTLVTLGIGGNDIGFAEVLGTCARVSGREPAGSACRDYYRRDGRDELADRVAAVGPKVAATLRAIARHAPGAEILVVGYPTILPDSGPGCFPKIPFSPRDVAYLRQTEQALNAVLATRAGQADAVFVDTYRPSIGHDICAPPGSRWVESLVLASPAAPMHPNALGMRASAEAVLGALRLKPPANSQ
jgi:lysophospholipase L1-like esterase